MAETATPDTRPASTTGVKCNGWCLPLYIYGGIAVLGLGANFIFDRRPAFGQRVWNLFSNSLWAAAFGVVIFFLCRYCKLEWAYLALIVPSILFGLSMILLLLQRPRA